MQYKTPEDAGFSSEKIAEAKKMYDTLGSSAFMVIYDGNVLISWGDIERRFMCHSIRKSFLSAMYGVHAKKGDVDLNKTIKELQITDNIPLNEIEETATVKDLLKARSGIYLSAAYETPKMKEMRPKRGSHTPNTFWYYNNWDFNVLAAIYQRETGKDIFIDFNLLFAKPLQMQDYRETDGYYHVEPENSIYPAYPFRMSTRDMARFGLLFLRNGKWNNKQIVSANWIRESTASYSDAGNGGGYGYLWWTNGYEGMLDFYSARGAGGHVIGIVPSKNIVFVHRVDTYKDKSVAYNDAFKLAKMILAAHVFGAKKNPQLISLSETKENVKPIQINRDILKKYINTYKIDNKYFSIVEYKDGLMLVDPTNGRFRIFPVLETKFYIEDIEQYLTFELNNEGIPAKIIFE